MSKTKQKVIKTDGTQLFTMPIGKEADDAYEAIKLFLNRKKYRLRKKYRGKNASTWGDVKKKDATWVAVYLDRKYTKAEQDEKFQRYMNERNTRIEEIERAREEGRNEIRNGFKKLMQTREIL